MTGLQKLQEIGAHKIYEKTHIAKKFAQNILDGEFSTMNKIQFAGFISILEREYNVDLHELIEAYGIITKEQNSGMTAPFVVTDSYSKTKENSKILYIVAGVFSVVLIFAYINFSSTSEEVTATEKNVEFEPVNEENEFNNTTIEEARVNLNNLDNNAQIIEEITEDETIKETIEDIVTAEPKHISQFIVSPRSTIWIGMINQEDFKRQQKLTAESFELDASKDWLLVMGHGFINFEVNGEKKEFEDKNKVWFSYENGVLTKITKSEFKEKNRGNAW